MPNDTSDSLTLRERSKRPTIRRILIRRLTRWFPLSQRQTLLVHPGSEGLHKHPNSNEYFFCFIGHVFIFNVHCRIAPSSSDRVKKPISLREKFAIFGD